jgi:hypothetical protein
MLALPAANTTHARVAEDFKTTLATVRQWWERFQTNSGVGLVDAPRPGAPKADRSVTATQRTKLERLTWRARINRHIAVRAKIALACAEGLVNLKVDNQLRTTPETCTPAG